MLSLYEAKELVTPDTPLLLFDCTLNDGRVERWSTHNIQAGTNAYSARVLRQNVFESQLSSDLGVDTIPRISLDLANADSHFSEIERQTGFKGGQLSVSIVFADIVAASTTTDPQVIFKGVLNAPEQITESACRLSASNRLSLQRVVLPDTRIQKRCPWEFPATPDQRQEAVNGGDRGIYSRYYRCGYSPDIAGGVGNLDSTGKPFTSCSYTRKDCTARGMFQTDTLLRPTARFGGIEFVPSTITVRSAGEKGSHLSPLSLNETRYNDFVPLIYGRAWHSPSIVFARNDGNLTRIEVLVGSGSIQQILKVLVNQVDIPAGQAGRNMTGTGWYSIINSGQRNGAFNADFADGAGKALGDPYGSMCFLSVVVPNKISDGKSLPDLRILLDGLQIPQYSSDGSVVTTGFSNNPVWVIADLLLRTGWSADEFDLGSFAASASYCAEQIQASDLFGNPVLTPRFQCNLVVKSRRAASDVIRGIRNSARLFLRYGSQGKLQLVVENTMALQQSSKSAGSNATYTVNGGWPAYEFGDGTSGTSGIARRANRESSVRVFCKASADVPNRFVTEFQDAFNDYQQDSFSIVDADDVARIDQEVTSTLPVLGIPHVDQAARLLRFNLAKSVHGNTFIEFDTSVKAFGLSPGDLIAVTYLKEGFQRQAFRIIRLQPGLNYLTASITAQFHDDSWYDDTNGDTPGGTRRQHGAELALPRPLA